VGVGGGCLVWRLAGERCSTSNTLTDVLDVWAVVWTDVCVGIDRSCVDVNRESVVLCLS